jgi:hypothetical protein
MENRGLSIEKNINFPPLKHKVMHDPCVEWIWTFECSFGIDTMLQMLASILAPLRGIAHDP